jgi:integrase
VDSGTKHRLAERAAQAKAVLRKTQKAVRDQLTAARGEHQKGLPVATERQTVATFLNRWLSDVCPTLKPKTQRSYRSLARHHIIPTLGRIELAKLTPQDVESMMMSVAKSGRSARTAQYARAVLRAAINRGLKWGLIGRNVAALADGPRVTRKVVEPFTADEVPALLSAFDRNRLGPLFLIAIAHGLRQGELLALRWCDLDLDKRQLRVIHTLQRVNGSPTLLEPKSARSVRSISLCDVAVDALLLHRKRQNEEKLLAGAEWENSLGLVFTTSAGRPLDGINVTRTFQRVLRAGNLPIRRFHDLRHTAASFLLLQGVQPRVVMDMLGHSEIRVTLDLYSHVAPALQFEAASRMNELLAVAR